MTQHAPQIALALSGFLSMIGSILVAFTWAYPKSNRKKHGRILLFWLSVSDFFSSLFYFLSAFPTPDEYCVPLALLDMFFPIASFIWTDIIAYYLYLVVKNRSSKSVVDWQNLLLLFHILAWGTATICVMIVGIANQAGRYDANNDDTGKDNTGGWCWIKNSGRRDTFLWELAGGKFVEWVSGIIIVPFLYISVACELYQIEKRNYGIAARESILFGKGIPSVENGTKDKIKKSPSLKSFKSEGDAVRNIFHAHKTNKANEIVNERSISGTESVDGNKTVKMVKTGKSAPVSEAGELPPFHAESEDPCSDSELISSQMFDFGKHGYEDYESAKSYRTHSQSNMTEPHDTLETNRQVSNGDNGQNEFPKQRTSSAQSGKYFTKFYMKLALLPLVFIFVRFWGSLRVILVAVNSPAASNETLEIFQTIFDPSQGFFNAILFVLFSKNDRKELITNLKRFFREICCFCCYKKEKNQGIMTPDIESSAQVFHEDGLATANQLRDKLMQNQSLKNIVSNSPPPRKNENGGRKQSKDDEFLQIDDLSDYECDDENRLSNFSFDSRMESVPTPSQNLPIFNASK